MKFAVPVNVGLAEKTAEPVPVSSVRAAARFALDGVPRKVAIPAPNEVIPVPPFATASVPPSVKVPLEVIGPPVSVRPVVPPEPETEVTLPPPVPAPIAVRNAAASSAETVLSALKRGNVIAPGLVRVKRFAPMVVAPNAVRAPAASVAPVPPRATDSVPVVPAIIGRPVAFVRIAEAGVPRFGVTRVGEVLKTTLPVPVSLVRMAESSLEVSRSPTLRTLLPLS